MRKLFKNEIGITLVALVVTIIILLILAGVGIATISGENGIFKQTEKAREENIKAESKEELQMVLLEAKIEREKNPNYNKNEFLNEFITSRIGNSQINEDNVQIGKYELIIDRDKLIIISEKKKEIETEIKGESLIKKVSEIKSSGQYEIEVKGNISGVEESVKYNVNVIEHNGNLILDGANSIEGATLTEATYEFGDKTTDVATETEDAKNMVVLKVNGNLTINEGITLTACKSDSGYGGPKGMLIYCSGTITNNGTISMTARGAKAEGQNVYLWQNSDGSYEYVPAVGAKGADSQVSSGSITAGIKGENGNQRATGGGGSGAAKRYSEASGTRLSGKGAAGTSYSGGSGGGAVCARNAAKGQDAAINGGVGGKGITNYSTNYGAGGGAGNRGGMGMRSSSTYDNATFSGENGTGGLLIIYSNIITNNGIIESNGSKGGRATSEDNIASGGSSGAGSINIFYKEDYINKDNTLISCISPQIYNGGAGGDGSITIGKISNGTYIEKAANKEERFLIEVYDHIGSNCASVSEVRLEDESGNTIPYTVKIDEVYDSANSRLPYYWKNTSYWNYTNLYDGNTSHTTNTEGGLNCTLFLYNSSANTEKYARFIIETNTISEIKDIKICIGNAENRTPKALSVYKVNDYTSDTYTNNVAQRDNTGLTLLKTVDFSEVIIEPTWYSFMK